LRFDLLSLMPPSIADPAPGDGDERFKTVTARRPVLEQVLSLAADNEAAIDMLRGTSVRELVVDKYNGTPHVRGVRTDAGEALYADLVVDAKRGRRAGLRLAPEPLPQRRNLGDAVTVLLDVLAVPRR
jgi:hypothetical protein